VVANRRFVEMGANVTEPTHDFVAWVALSSVPRIGSVLLSRLIDQFGTADRVLTADEADLLQISGVGKHICRQIKSVDSAQMRQNIKHWQSQGFSILTIHDAAYPKLLRDLRDAPPTLYAHGGLDANNTRTIAIVGTRRPSPAAGECARQLAQRCAQHGWTVVSGLALGIDTHAHRGALDVPNGRTVAVLGCGLNRIYPQRSQKLAAQISDRGAIFSEVNPDMETTSPQLVARNRIITGLSRAVIVVEAGANSGALHAARFARMQDRWLCAADFVADGNYALIRDGATMIQQDLTNIDTFLDALETVSD
jgi:DNA processing protein